MLPMKKQFTYLEISRLDNFLISDKCKSYIQNTSMITAGIRSDHKCVVIEINLNDTKRGPGSWKLNTSVLNDTKYMTGIKELIQKVNQNNVSLSKQLVWEIKIKEYSISYCTKKNKQ